MVFEVGEMARVPNLGTPSTTYLLHYGDKSINLSEPLSSQLQNGNKTEYLRMYSTMGKYVTLLVHSFIGNRLAPILRQES